MRKRRGRCLMALALVAGLAACDRSAVEGATRELNQLVAGVSGEVAGKGGGCERHFVGGQAPQVSNPKLGEKTRSLCYEEFAVLHSGLTRTPLWSAEHLNAAQLRAARDMERRNTFHAEERLPPGERAELEDYKRSGWDRGHMAPSGDMPTPSAQHESFSLANIVPQHPQNNQKIWSDLESAVRRMAERQGELYVITGPLFEGARIKQLNGRVAVPTAVYKLVYDPKSQRGAAYVTPNAPGCDYAVLSVADLESRAGINFLPALPPAQKQQRLTLPKPNTRRCAP